MKLGYNLGVFISSLFFALSFIWSKQALEYLTPVMIVTFRVTIALILIGSFALLSGRLQRINGRDAGLFMLLALAEPVGYFLFEISGIDLVTPTLACLIIGLIPVITPFAARAINGEQVSKYSWIGLFVGFIGVVVVALSHGVDTLGGQLAGILLLFGAVVTAIIYTLMVQRLSRRFNSYSIVAWQNVFSILYLVPIVLFFDFDRLSTLTFSADWVMPVVTLGVLCSSVAFVLYANGIRELGVTRTGMYINMMPGMTAIASYFILGEELGWIKICGIGLAIAGLFIASVAPKSSLSH